MKKQWIAIAIALVILIILFVTLGIGQSKKDVKFDLIDAKNIPRELEADIIPNYRGLERAMACIIDGKVYILACRGEKPTAGFSVEIQKIQLETKKQKNNMIVYAKYLDPGNDEKVEQEKSYPICVAEAHITGLPDTIELKSVF